MKSIYGVVALAATLMGAILLLERTAAAASPTGIKNVVLVHGAFADGSGWEDGRSCGFLVLGVGTAVLHDISSMLTCRTLLDSVTLFPLSNLPLAVRLRFNNCLNETNGGNLYGK